MGVVLYISGRGAECHSGECLQDGLCSGKGKTTHIQRVDRTAAYSAEGKVPGIYAFMQLSSEFVDSLCVTRVWQAPVSDYIYHAGRHVKMEEELVQVCFVDRYRVWIKNGKGGWGWQVPKSQKVWDLICWCIYELVLDISYQIQY